jgi:hypothetical protein
MLPELTAPWAGAFDYDRFYGDMGLVNSELLTQVVKGLTAAVYSVIIEA